MCDQWWDHIGAGGNYKEYHLDITNGGLKGEYRGNSISDLCWKGENESKHERNIGNTLRASSLCQRTSHVSGRNTSFQGAPEPHWNKYDA